MNEKLKRKWLVLAIVLSLVPCAVLMKAPATPHLAAWALWASAILGYMGIVLLLWMYVLGTKSVVGLMFADLAPVLKIHKWLGKYGSVAIFVHPLLITYSYGESWLYALTPQIGSVAERHIMLGQIALAILLGVWITSAFVRGKLSFRAWRYIHWLSYVCIPFALLHVPDLGSQEQGSVVVKSYLLVLGLTFGVFSILRLRGLLNLDRTTYRVVSKGDVTAIDRVLTLAPIGARRIRPRAGQYLYLKLGLLSEDHPFTVTSYDEVTGTLTVVYRVAGMFTNELGNLEAGSKVFLSGPYGGFMDGILRSTSTPVVYLSGGIGITPLVSLILDTENTREQWLFAANRTRETAALYPLLSKRLGGRAIAVYSMEDSDLEYNEERGYITADLLRKYLDAPTKYRYYLCGPPAMMDAMRSVVRSLGVPVGQVFSETFGW